MKEQELIDTTEKLFTRTRARRHRDWIRIGIHCLIIVTFLALFRLHWLDRLENIVLDVFLRTSGFSKVHPSIALIEISDSAISEVGEWPWPRRYHAVMARLLSEWGAAAILFDFNFTNKTLPNDDQDLARTLQKIRAPYYLPVGLKPKKEKKFWLHGLPVVLEKSKGEMEWAHSLPEIEANAKGVGHRELVTDSDGVLRRFSPFLSDGNETLPFLPFSAAYDLLGTALPAGEDLRAVIGSDGKILIPWIKKWRQKFERYDFADLIHGFYGMRKGMSPKIPPEKIRGKICLIGITASENFETRATPLEVSAPPLAAVAHVMNGVLTGQWIRVASAATNASLLILIGILATVFFFVFRGTASLLSGIFLGVSWFCGCFLAFCFFHLWFFSVYPILLILSLFTVSAVYIQLTAAREKSALFHLATRDGLTDLYVIRHFRLIMNQIVREAAVRKEPLSVILLDLDHFKAINDLFGHPAGDMVLQKVADILTKYIRKKRPFGKIDFAARYGGEEFIIMLRKAGLNEAAQAVAERIRKKIEEAKFEWEGKNIPVTASLGVATLRPGENVPDPMVRRADAALYRAKNGGRNRVCTEKI